MDRGAWKATVSGVARVGHNLATKVLLLLLGPWYLIFKVDMYGTSQVVLVVKNLSANARDIRDTGLIPGSGRPPGEGNGYPLQDSCLENPMDRGAWKATVHGVARLGHNLATKPPPPSLENEMATLSSILAGKFHGWGAWQATVHGITKSRTRLSTHT